MTSIIDFALSKAKTTIVIAILVLLAGSYARQEIQVSSSPNIQLPFISVSVFLEGASPKDGSRLIARPIENNLRKSLGLDVFESYEKFSDSDLDEISDKKDEIILQEAAEILIDQILIEQSSRISFRR